MANDWKWVRCMASPKQPQSIAGLKIHNIRVMTVKNPIIPVTTQAVSLRKTPVTSRIPQNVSANAKNSPRTNEAGAANPIWKKFIYSLIIREVPVGSMSFRIPETKKTKPSILAQNLLVIFFIAVRGY